MRYNKKGFKNFINQNIKQEYKITMHFEAYCDDLEKQYNETGIKCYEMSKFETKSGNPELFYY